MNHRIINTFLLVILLEINPTNFQYSYQFENYNIIEDDLSHSKKSDYGTLTGDVQNWAAIIQNYIIQVMRQHLKILGDY